MLRRMRWFFLSILVIYLWMTPGQPLVGTTWWMPTLEGITLGGQRLLVLILLILAVHWLLFVTSRQQLIAALYWLVGPLSWFGFSRERFAVRIALIMELVAEVQGLVRNEVDQMHVAKGKIEQYADAATTLVLKVVSKAETDPCQMVEVDMLDSPSLAQWCYPLALAGFMFIIATL